MKKIFIILLINTFLSGASSQILIWPTVDPYIPFHTDGYVDNIKGYSKNIRQTIAQQYKDAYNDASEVLLLELRQLYTTSCSGLSVENTLNPTAEIDKENGVFVFLSCGLNIVTDEYPYYRTSKFNPSSEVFFSYKMYNAAGNLLDEQRFTEIIEYAQLKNDLKGLANYEIDAEVFHQSLLKSIKGETLKNLMSAICSAYSENKESLAEFQGESLTNSINLIVDNLNYQYPGYFKDFMPDQPDPASQVVQSSAKEDKKEKEVPPASEVSKVPPEMAAAFNKVRNESKNWALLIGENEYQSNSINDLAEPIDDARELAEILLGKYDFYDEEMIFLENPTREQIIASFDYLAANIKPADNLLIFYAGHGLWDESLEKGYWIPSDATTSNRANWFSNSDLKDYISGIKSHHTLLISDACFSGGIFKTRDAFNEISPATYELYKLPSRKAMTSGAMTTVPDHSVFIEYLIKRLDENELPFLSSEQLFASFKIAVINNSPTNQVPQFGEIRESGDEGGDFLFILK